LLYWKLARGSMGEDVAARESIACKKLAETYFDIEDNLHLVVGVVRLHSLSADKLICVQSSASEYNNCKNYLTLGEALMIKSEDIKGEMSIAS
jgi:hypothetical protein